jgi:ABC-type oligopeptide transport system substrate-binding subunit
MIVMRLVFAFMILLAVPAAAEPTYGLSLLGPLKLPADFQHFPYANPDAPKGGTVVRAANGSFDSFNSFIVRGSPAAGIGQIYDSLLANDDDEASAMYCHLCQTVDVAADHLSVTYTLRPEAKFNDGTPVTAEDVAWTFRTLISKGLPAFRAYYADVKDVVAEGDRTVVFHFKSAENRASCRSCRSIGGKAGISPPRYRSRLWAAGRIWWIASRPAAPSPTSTRRIGGRPICQPGAASIISARCATSISAIQP